MCHSQPHGFSLRFFRVIESSLTSRLTWFAHKLKQQQQNFINKQIITKVLPAAGIIAKFSEPFRDFGIFLHMAAIASKAIRGGTMRAKYKK